MSELSYSYSEMLNEGFEGSNYGSGKFKMSQGSYIKGTGATILQQSSYLPQKTTETIEEEESNEENKSSSHFSSEHKQNERAKFSSHTN